MIKLRKQQSFMLPLKVEEMRKLGLTKNECLDKEKPNLVL
jgi:hypothetical protein